MKTILIGIHGLQNKPAEDRLTTWWMQAIAEGFEIVNLPTPRFSFEMAYWAHFLHNRPQDPDISDPSHPLYLREPYIPGNFFGPRDHLRLHKKIKAEIHQQLMQLIAGESGFMNINVISNAVVHRMFVELDIYFHGTLPDKDGKSLPAREIIRASLYRLLRKHRDKNICLIAHSMGTIIAYDVLTHCKPTVSVNTLITCGSPLGFPVIRKKIKQELGIDEQDEVHLPTPEAISHRWVNLSDKDDVTCLNYNLRNHYQANTSGVRPFDRIVYNNYEHDGVKNPHKIYGYLRTLDFTQALNSFLVIENADFFQRLGWIFRPPKV